MVNSPPKRGDAKRAADRRRRITVLVGTVVVLAVIVGVAVATARGGGSRVSLADIAGSPTIEGQALEVLVDADPALDPAVGTAAPVVTGADFAGSPVSLATGGRPQLVMFLASWCPVCQAELPEVMAWQAAGGVPDGVDLVAVATYLDPRRPAWPPSTWLEREGYDGPVLVDDAASSVMAAYGMQATPSWVVLDADGEVVARHSGRMPLEQLTALAEGLVEG